MALAGEMTRISMALMLVSRLTVRTVSEMNSGEVALTEMPVKMLTHLISEALAGALVALVC